MGKQYIGTKPFRDTDSSTPTAIATGSPLSGERMMITDIAGSTETAGGRIVVKDGTTVIWEMSIPVISSTTPYGIALSFQTPLIGTVNTKVYVEVGGGGTATPYANIVGFSSKN